MRIRMTQVSVLTLLMIGTAFLMASDANAQSFQYPPNYNAWRGRVVARDGHGYHVRYRWGNGLTNNGAAVITSGFETLVPVAMAAVGRDVDNEARSRDAARDAARAADFAGLAEQQRQANALLVATARLLDPSFQAPAPAPLPPSPPSLGSGLNNVGADPWPSLPINDGTVSAPGNAGAAGAVAEPSGLLDNVGGDPWPKLKNN